MKDVDVEIEGLMLNGALHGDAIIRSKEDKKILFNCYRLGSEFEAVKCLESGEMWLFHAGRVSKVSSSLHPLSQPAVNGVITNYGSTSLGKRTWGNYEIVIADLPTHFRTDLFASVHSNCKHLPEFVTYSIEEGRSKTIFEFRIHHNQLLKNGLSLEYMESSPGSYLPYPSRVFLMHNNTLEKALCIVKSPTELFEICDCGRTYNGLFNHTTLCWEGEGVIKSGDPSNRSVEIVGKWEEDRLVGGKGFDVNGEEYELLVFSRLTKEEIATADPTDSDLSVDTIWKSTFYRPANDKEANDNGDGDGDGDGHIKNQEKEKGNRIFPLFPPLPSNSLLLWGYLPSIECLSLSNCSQTLTRLVFSCSFVQSANLTLQHFPLLEKVVVSYSNLEHCEQFFLLDLPALKRVVLCPSCLPQCSLFVIARTC